MAHVHQYGTVDEGERCDCPECMEARSRWGDPGVPPKTFTPHTDTMREGYAPWSSKASLPDGWIEPGAKPTAEDWEIPWPRWFPGPPPWENQQMWDLVIRRWMRLAVAALYKPMPVESDKPYRTTLRASARRLNNEKRIPIMGDEDEPEPGSSNAETVAFDGDLENAVRKAISDALLDYQPDKARFSTHLDQRVRSRILNRARNEGRQLNRQGVLAGDAHVSTKLDASAKDPTPRWAAAIDWESRLTIIAQELGPEYATLTEERLLKKTKRQEYAQDHGLTVEQVKYREKKLRKFVDETGLVGREAVFYRQDRQEEKNRESGRR